VAAFGAGTLGCRIALLLASRGGTVRIYDASTERVGAATNDVARNAAGLVEKRDSGEVGIARGAGTVAEALDDA